MRPRTLPFLLAAGILASVAPRASAEAILTPYAGIVFGSDVNQEHGAYGASLALTGGFFGFEVDFCYSPNFFGGDRALLPENNVSTLMGNFMFSGKVSPSSRIYAVVGGGLLKQRLRDTNAFFDVDRNDFGVDVGGGIILGLGDHLGIRGDIRYFRNVGDEEPDHELDIDLGSFSYWRATGGLSFTF